MELEKAIRILNKLKEEVALFSTGWKNKLKDDEKQAIETVLQALEKVIEERDIYKEEHDKITKALNFKKGSLNPSVELVIGSLKKALQNSIPKKKIEDKINRRITKLNAERNDNFDYASDYDFEIQLWEEMKQELLEE